MPGCTEFVFRNAMPTREAIFTMRVFFQRFRDTKSDIYVCHVENLKVFGKLKLNHIIKIDGQKRK